MWRRVGLLRDRAGLDQAVTQLQQWTAPPAAGYGDAEQRRVQTLVTVGLLMARAALRRQESRGGHFRSDFPAHDDIHWKKHVADALR